MDIDKAIKTRRSIRKFNDKKVDWRDIIEAVDASRHAPSAGNIFTMRFVIVDDKEKIQKIAKACQQSFVAEVDYVVVACSNPLMLTNTFGKSAVTFNKQQSGAAIQNFLLKLHDTGLSSCWVGDFVEEQIKRTLKIPDNVDVEAIFPIGYAFDKSKAKSKKPDLDSYLYFNEYKQKRMKKDKKLDV